MSAEVALVGNDNEADDDDDDDEDDEDVCLAVDWATGPNASCDRISSEMMRASDQRRATWVISLDFVAL